MQLIYVGDPMCSWCYGFGHALDTALQDVPDATLELVMGGVRAGATDVLDDAGKQFRLGHWARVEALSGLPFNREALLARQGFVYDTEPVCRAVVLARRHLADRALLGAMRDLQRAFYVDGADTTDGDVLLHVLMGSLRSRGVEVTRADLARSWADAGLRAETAADFAQARAWGIRSFPALLARTPDGIAWVTDGYQRPTELRATVQAFARRMPATTAR